MNFRRSEREAPEINLTPLIDVVFLLLIFFMVSTTFDRASELAIDLPKAESEAEAEEKAVIDIGVDVQGRFYINGRQLVNTQLATVIEALRVASNDSPDLPLVVNADKDAPYQAIVTVMDAARQLGLARLRFPTQKVQER